MQLTISKFSTTSNMTSCNTIYENHFVVLQLSGDMDVLDSFCLFNDLKHFLSVSNILLVQHVSPCDRLYLFRSYFL